MYVSKDVVIFRSKTVSASKVFGKHFSRELSKKPDYKIKKTDLKCGMWVPMKRDRRHFFRKCDS